MTHPSETRTAPVRVESSLHRFIAAESKPSAVATVLASWRTCWWLCAFLVAAAGDDGADADHVAVRAQERDEAELRVDGVADRADLDRAVLALLDARADDAAERLDGGRAHLGVGVVRSDVRDRLELEA